MAKNQNVEPKVIENEIEGQEQQANENAVSVKLLIVKGEQKKLSDSVERGWTADGVAVSDDTHAIVVSLNETESAFGGVESQDEETGVASPSMSDFDGEMRTDFLIAFFGMESGAPVTAKDYGWLPSGGEMAFIFAHKDAINALIEAAGGDTLGDGEYWTSQKFSNERVWSMNMQSGAFGIDRGCVSELKVRSIKSLNI